MIIRLDYLDRKFLTVLNLPKPEPKRSRENSLILSTSASIVLTMDLCKKPSVELKKLYELQAQVAYLLRKRSGLGWIP